jgi:hypothetical protein
MVVSRLPDETSAISDRVRRTVALLRRRGYALTPSRLGEICLGGHVSELEVRWAAAAAHDLAFAENLVVERDELDRAGAIRARAAAHRMESMPYLAMTREFVRKLVAVAPFIRSVSIAGSLASGGFRASDDVDLNLVVDDGHRHIAYVVINALGLLHAFGHRAKPVDDLSRRPVAPRLMTANLILERSQCHPLARQDEDMAFEFLMSETVFGGEEIEGIIRANPILVEHFPQLAHHSAPIEVEVPRRLPNAIYPRFLDHPARWIGQVAWRYMQWTRRKRPEALARVAYVRQTMRPYTLFDVT